MLWKNVTVRGTKVVASVGDTVWYYPQGQLSAEPSVGILQEISDEDFATISVLPNTESARIVRHVGVPLVDDPRLENGNVAKRGAWLPRGPWPFLPR